jgi:uncharacterized protein YecE (DUF72 family)
VGTAAWANPPAEGRNRAEDQSHLDYYAAHFNAVEINSAFYRSHKRATYERWRDSTPSGFRFCVKVPRSVTHESALRHCVPDLRKFLDEIGGLAEKLGVVLVQTPASVVFEARVAASFFRGLAAAIPCPVACEPRHASWFSPKANDTLRRYGISRVAADPAKIPGGDEPAGAERLIYYRLHGSPRMYYSAYSVEFVQDLAVKIAASTSKSRDVWCIFDNTARHESWQNALQLQRLLADPARQIPSARSARTLPKLRNQSSPQSRTANLQRSLNSK